MIFKKLALSIGLIIIAELFTIFAFLEFWFSSTTTFNVSESTERAASLGVGILLLIPIVIPAIVFKKKEKILLLILSLFVVGILLAFYFR